jgi:spermidine/putrescine transport system ATP-binding protein
MTVSENVAFGLKMARVDRRETAVRAAEALELVGLEEFGDRLPGQLSGGQQQRVAVARALVRRPDVLLLDEPLGALDLKLRKRLQVELSQIHREVGTTFVYVTHDQEEAMAMSDRIAVLQSGHIEQIGTPEEIYSRPVSRFVADFIGESNFFQAGRDGGPPGTVVLADGTRVGCAPVEAPNGASTLTLVVRPEAIQVSGVADAPPGALTARVVQTSFLGSYTRVAVRSDASPEPVVVAIQRAAATLPDLDPDRTVALWWKPEDAVPVFEAGGERRGQDE